MNNVVFRPPTAAERKQLIEWLSDQGHDSDIANDLVQAAYIAVFPSYTSGSPGYVGRVMVVVWDGGPSFHNVFTWTGDCLYSAAPEGYYGASEVQPLIDAADEAADWLGDQLNLELGIGNECEELGQLVLDLDDGLSRLQ